jgi:hypothetical protein
VLRTERRVGDVDQRPEAAFVHPRSHGQAAQCLELAERKALADEADYRGHDHPFPGDAGRRKLGAQAVNLGLRMWRSISRYCSRTRSGELLLRSAAVMWIVSRAALLPSIRSRASPRLGSTRIKQAHKIPRKIGLFRRKSRDKPLKPGLNSPRLLPETS